MRPSRSLRISAWWLALLCAAIHVPGAVAGNAPPWMHAQVDAPLPAHDDKTSAVLLYSETVVTIQPTGKVRRLEREAYKILRAEGASRGVARVDFDSQSRVIGLRAWSIPATGKDFEAKERDIVESALPGVEGGELVSDIRTRLLTIPAAVPGSIVGYEVELEQTPYVMGDTWQFQDTVPVREARYSLQLPPGWGYKATWLNHPEVAPTAAGTGRWDWVVSDIKAMRLERSMPPWRGLAGKMVVSLQPANGLDPGFQSWQDMGTWYTRLARGRRDVSPEIRQKVHDLTVDEPTQLAKMQALARFVQKDIRYVAIELGIGGLQPHAAAEVFAHRYGDCKDKTTLLSAMLEEIGIHSFYLIINTRRGSITASTPPNLGFNHVLIAIQLPPNVESKSLVALTSHPKLNRVLFFDPTDPLTPFGQLSGALQANYGVLVAPDGGELLALPQSSAISNSIQRTAKLTLDETGTLRGDVHEVWIGDMAAFQRYALRSATVDADRIRPVEAVLAESLATFQIEKASLVSMAETEKPLEWKYSMAAEQYAKMTGALVLLRPRVLGTKASNLMEAREPREYAIEFDGPERDVDVFEIALPAGYEAEELPPAVKVDYGFAAYQSSSEMVGNTLRYTRTFEIKDLSIPASKADELKKFYRIILNDERMSAVLKRASR